jgi:hypothetical protein
MRAGRAYRRCGRSGPPASLSSVVRQYHIMDSSVKPPKKHNLPLEDVIAPLIFILAIAGAIFGYRLAGAPFWLAAILGLPTGFITLFGCIWLLARLK